MVQLLDTDNGSALRKPAATHKGAFFTLPDYQFTFFAFMALYAGGLGGWLRRKDIAFLVQSQSGLAVRILTASEERAEPTVFMYHRLAALGTFMFTDALFYHFPLFIAGTGKFAIRIR